MDKKRMESLMDQVIAHLEEMADEEAMKTAAPGKVMQDDGAMTPAHQE